MFYKLTMQQRLLISIVMVIAFLMILGSNRMNQKYYTEVNNTVNSVYHDRLVVQDYIYELNNTFHQKQLRLISHENSLPDSSNYQRIERILNDFGETELTQRESQLFNELKKQIIVLEKLEEENTQSDVMLDRTMRTAYLNLLKEIEKTLSELSRVQLDEGSVLTIFSRDLLGMISLISNIEITFMVLIGLVILILIINPLKTSQSSA